MTTPAARIGQRYEQLRELGTGGTAVVFEAMDHVLHRRCAVKLLLEVPGPGGDARSARLRQEAAALASLDHPRVVRVYDLGEHEGRPFLAMEFVPGGSLADRLLASGPLTPAEAVDRILEVLDALDAAHSAGIVHRDVKPHNVLLRDDGTAALADFGIARNEAVSHTRTGVALGSVDYMAPEQRIDARRAGPAADVYGVGCTLFHLLSGETPVDLYLAPAHSPRWEAIPGPLRSVLRQATSVDPGDRYQTAEAMGADLRRVRPAVDRLEAYAGVPSRTLSPQPTRAEGADGYVPTVDEGSVAKIAVVEPRPHSQLGPEEWAWASQQGPRTGLGSVTFAMVTVSFLVLVAVFLWPVLEARLETVGDGAELPAAFGAGSLPGRWQGAFGVERHGGTLHIAPLHGEEDGEVVVSGDFVLDLDGNGLDVHLDGRFRPARSELRLEGTDGVLLCWLDRYGVCRGQLRWGATEMPFALVHMGR